MRTIQVPGYGPVKFPDDMSDTDIALAIERDILPTITPPKEGLGAALVGGAKRLGSAVQTGFESIFDPEGAAKRGLERGEALAQQYAPGADLEKVLTAYREKGLLPAAGKAISQIPGALAEQAPNIAASFAGARAGARFGLPGAAIGAAAPALGQLYGSFLERQAEEGQPVSRGKALAAAAPGAALEVASMYIPLGRNVVGKLLGPEVEKALAKGTNEAIERVAKESLGKTLAKGTAVGLGVEGGTEITQTMLERLQAGLPLTTPDALAEYGQAAYGAALVGGPFGAVGRVGERGVARGKIEERQAEERRIQDEIAAKEREQAAQAEEARKATPEYRSELNDKIWTLKDELAQVEPIAKDKTQDEDVRNEAIARAKEIKAQLKEAMEAMKASMKQAGLAPTFEQAKAAGVREMPIVDEFGNIVKPKGKYLTEEEYGQQLEGAAKQWDQTREKLFELREKDLAEQEAKKEKTSAMVEKQVQGYLRSLDEYDTLLEEEKIQKGLKAREEATKENTFQRAMERIQKAIDNFGFNLIGYASDPAVQQLKTQIADLSRPEAIAAAPDRNAYLQQIDVLKTQLNDAVDKAPRNSGEGLRRLIDEGRVTRDVTSALGITGLGGKTVTATEALPNIQARIAELEEKRKEAPKQNLMEDDGTLTKAGVQLVKNEVRLNELKRLQTIAKQQETGGEAAAQGVIEAAGKTAQAPTAVEIESGKPTGVYRTKADEANKQANGSFTDLTAYMDDYRKGRFFGEKGAKRDVELASYTREGLLKESEALRKDVVDSLINEVAYRRMEQGLQPFTRDEAIGLGIKADEVLKEIINRSTALPSGYSLERVVITPSKSRGTKIVEDAKTQLRDTRDLKDRQFGAPQRAMEVLAEMLKQAKDEAIAAGQRPVRADKGTLQLLKSPQKAAPADLVKDLDRVLRMENLQPDVANTLEAARRRMEEGGISAELEELLDEQVGRILRGTDRPFTLERDVTKPGGKRAMAAAGTAELVDDIKARMRFESETAQYATAEDRTLVPSGKRFAEVDVQSDLFPETVATTRATPGMFQRLQKSVPVQRERERVAEQKAKAEQAKRETLLAARAVEAELKPEAIQGRKHDLLAKIKKLVGEVQQKIKTSKFETPAALMEKVNEPQVRALLSRIEVAAKDLKAEDAEFEISSEGMRLTWVPASTLQKWAMLDESIVAETKKIKELERVAARANEGSLEQRKARALAKQQRVAVQQVVQARKKLTEQIADRERALKVRIQQGLGLSGVKAVSKTKEEILEELLKSRKEAKEKLKKAKTEWKKLPPETRKETPEPKKEPLVRPSRIKLVPIKSKAELDAEIAQRQQETIDDLRRRSRSVSPEAMYENLKTQEKEANTAFKNAKDSLAYFVKQVKGGEKAENFPEYKKLSNAIDRAKAQLNSIRENLRLLEATQYEPEKVKRQPARGPIGGEVKWYDKKFTPDQMRQMSGLGLSSFSGKSYSVDDNIDFRIGDTAGGGIDLEQANKRMADVEQKAKSMGIKFKYFPTMKDVTLDILNDMQRQGVDVYETQIRGGVKPDGTVFVIGENHTDMTDLEKTLAHEFVGHHTFEGLLGEDGMTKLMVKVDKSFATKDNENGLEVLAKQLGVENEYRDAVVSAAKFYEQQLSEGKMTEREVRNAAKTKGLREIIAYTMEKRVDENFLQKAKRWIQELVGAFRAALKNMGLIDAANMSTSDLFYMMKQANKAFEEGKPIAYRNADGSVNFRAAKPKYAPGFEELGAITDKIVGRQEGKWDNIKANVRGMAGRVQFVDRFAALEALANRGVVKGIIDSLKAADMMYFARMSDQRHSFVSEIATNGTLKLKDSKRSDGRIEKIIESERGANLKDISQTLLGAGVGDGEATGRLFTLYLAAERAQRVGIEKLNFGGGITQADLKKALDFGRSNAAFQKAREMYNEYNRGLIDFAVQTGAISKEEGARLSKTNDYVPFYRMQGGVVNLFIGGENPIRIGDIKNQPYLKELVGGDEAIMDFFTSSLQNTTLLTDLALRNLATRNAAFTLKDLGIAEIHNGDGPADRDVIRFSMDDVDKNGKVVHRKKWARVNTQAKQELFGDIPSDLVVKGMEGMQVIMPGVVRMMGMPANWVRKFVTRDPRYAVRQIFRDSLAATLTTGANIKPVVDTMGEIVKMYGKGSEAFKKLQQRGVLGGQVITGAPEDMAKIMQQIASGKPGWDLAMAKLDQFAMAGDAGTRIAMYNSFLKQGLSEREATLAALESMNFGRRGVSPSMYILNATIPFFNAGVQGIDVLYRAYKGQMPYEQQLKVKKKLYMRGAMIAMMTMAYAAMMQDDEAYKNAEPEQRYGNWFIRIPGISEPFKVPIPFEVGLIFKAVPEGIYNALFSGEKGSKVAKDLTMQFIRSLPGNLAEVGVPLPTALKPFIELGTNMSLFTGRDVVDARLEKLEKSMQYRDKTPELIKLLGQFTHIRVGDTEIGLSPVQLEHVVRTLTGSLGIGVASILNPALRTGAEAGEVEGRVTDMPIIGGMFQPNDAGRVINEAYESIKMIEKKQGTFKALITDGKTQEAQDYIKANAGDIGLASYAGAFRQRMGEITKVERAIKSAPASQMSPEEKRKQLDQMRDVKIQMAQNFKTVREQIERQAAR